MGNKFEAIVFSRRVSYLILMHIIGGQFKNQKLLVPKGAITRPTSGRLREALFNICQSYIEEAYVLDLFAGSGAIGFEALSRGASHVTFVDQAKESRVCLEENTNRLNVQNLVEIRYGDVFLQLKQLEKKGKQFDIIYVDPPYDAFKIVEKKQVSFSALILKMIDEGKLLKPNGKLFIEDSIDSKPNENNLLSLEFINSRRLGRSCLQQYIKAL